jgi:murein DD-endopeptidase MepM/ murein hydrolase activator NlpD
MSLFMALVFAISLLVSTAEAGKCRLYYKVRKGDSLWKIADRYNIYIKDILRVNPKLKKRKYLRPGQKICIPHKKRRTVKRKSSGGYFIYVVKPGDSLEKIGKRFGVSWKKIKKINNLKGTRIRVGQKLKIPSRKVAKKKKRYSYRKKGVVYIKYRVRRGDSLIKIAKKFGVSWKEIKRVNGLKSNIVRRGQLIKVPVPRKAFEKRYIDKPRIRLAFLPVEGKFEKGMRGIDIYADCGEKVRAVAEGRVIYSGDDLATYGNMVIVEHKGFLTIYAYHMQNLVERGERVQKGEVIGKVGLKPGSGRCALHFEIRAKDGSVLNPVEYLGKK